ncbi:glycosyltransferase family 4 protein [uncultured Tenacibaculum sp.]|uniref:glycosyltransferase family 4 protein n=1 Tax=uncultured Tenacibaculum sp. TaxID=174713 RepID=UPI002619596A|nr:glycosyltransferase family 4 protein [uncultured Tenacibaculum sp.]
MNILIANTLYYPYQIGGAEKSVQSLAEQLYLLGNNVLVISLSEQEKKQSVLNGVANYTLELKNLYWPFNQDEKSLFEKIKWHINDINNTGYDQSFSNIFQTFNPDVLLTNNLSGFSTSIWKIAKSFNIKTVHVLRDYYLQCPKTTKFKNNTNCVNLCTDCRILSKLKKKSTKHVDYLIGISHAIIKDHLKEGYFKNTPHKVIYNGFTFESKQRVLKDKSKELVFGYIGQIKESKGIEMLLKALKKIKNESWKLLIAGKCSDSYKLKLETINPSKNIYFLNYVKPSEFFNQISILIVPSLWNEPFGRVVIESLMYKKPVLANSVGGIKELLSNNKSFLIKPTTESLTDKLKMIIDNPDFIDSFIFDDKFISQFSIEKTSQMYIDVFREILVE